MPVVLKDEEEFVAARVALKEASECGDLRGIAIRVSLMSCVNPAEPDAERKALVFVWRDFGVGLSNPALPNLTNSHWEFNDGPLPPLLICFAREEKSLCDPESTLALPLVVFLCESTAFAGNQAAPDILFNLVSLRNSCPAGRYISGFSDYIKTGRAGAPLQWHC